MESFEITGEYIELIKLLKAMGIAEHGADAKSIVESEQVLLNGQPELRKRAKLKRGDVITVNKRQIKII